VKRFSSMRCSGVVRGALFLAAVLVPSVVQAQWEATAGAESKDMGTQALAFLPNELWVHVNDSIQWTFPAGEIHTVTFLRSGQIRPPFPVGCPPPATGVQPSGSGFSGSACVNSGPLAGGASYTVTFPSTGNFKLVCLVHSNMTGLVHVLDLFEPLPHSQRFYTDQAADEARDLLADEDHQRVDEERSEHAKGRLDNLVTAGIGEVVATAGGRQTRSVMRFFDGTIRVHVGETVEWTNLDPTTPHTVTFGTEPVNPMMLVNVTTDKDGAEHGTIHSATDSVSSGFLASANEDNIGLPQSPAGATRIRVTFTKVGTYDYICALHDTLGMKGKVVVVH
jgi:plastocyanin